MIKYEDMTAEQRHNYGFFRITPGMQRIEESNKRIREQRAIEATKRARLAEIEAKRKKRWGC